MNEMKMNSLTASNLGRLGEFKSEFDRKYAPTVEYFTLNECRVNGLSDEQPLNLMSDAILPITQNHEGWVYRNFVNTDLQKIVDVDFDGIRVLAEEQKINLEGFSHYENGFERRIVLVSPDESLVLATETHINEAGVTVTKAGLWRL